MKRWVRGAMALIITFSLALGSCAFAIEAIEEENVSVPMEEGEALLTAELYEPDAVAEEGDLPIDESESDGETVPEAPALQEEPVEAPETGDGTESGAEAPIYAAVAAETEICDASGGARIATLAAEGTALVLSQAAEGWFEIAVCTERGIITGCAMGEGLRALDAEAVIEYMDALAAREDVTTYGGDVNRPLAPIACAFADEEEVPAQAATTDDAKAPETSEVPAEPAEPETPADAEEPQDEAKAEPEGGEQAEEDAAKAGGVESPEGAEAPEASETPETSEVPETVDTSETPETSGTPETADASETVESQEASAVAAESAAVSSGSESAEKTEDSEKTTETGDATDTAKTDAANGSDASTYAAAPIGLNMTAVKMGIKERYNGLKTTGGTGTIKWSSSNRKIVTVDASTGMLRGVKKGSAVITATSGDGTTASAKVTVKGAPKKIKFKPAKAKMGANGQTLQLKLKLGKGAASAGTSYVSSDAAVATVDGNGVVTSHAAGIAVITATTYNGKKATCKLTVYSVPAPSAIKLPANVSIGVKETRDQLPVELVPEAGATGCTAEITWSSTDKKVVKVDPKTGAIKALKKGKATIVARTANGLKAKCKVTVKKAPKKVVLKGTASTVNVGATVQYSTTLPKGTASGITWSSSDSAVASIDQNGLATGVKAGKVTITAKTYNGKTATATLTVKSSSKTSDPGSGSGAKIEVPASMEKLGIASYQNVYSAELSNEQKLEYVIYCAQNQLGKPYKYGYGYTNDSDPSGFDCSGFVYWCFSRAHIKLEQSAYKQGYDDKYTQIRDIESLKRGDVVCFNTSSDNDLSDHTGIYLGNGYFIHASSGASKRKVVVQRFTGDSISNNYYKGAFSWGRRILK